MKNNKEVLRYTLECGMNDMLKNGYNSPIFDDYSILFEKYINNMFEIDEDFVSSPRYDEVFDYFCEGMDYMGRYYSNTEQLMDYENIMEFVDCEEMGDVVDCKIGDYSVKTSDGTYYTSSWFECFTKEEREQMLIGKTIQVYEYRLEH